MSNQELQKAILVSRFGEVRELDGVPGGVVSITTYGEPITEGEANKALVSYDPLSTDSTIIGYTTDTHVSHEYYIVNSSPITSYLVYSSTGGLGESELKALLSWYQNKVATGLSSLNAVSELSDDTYKVIKDNIPMPDVKQPDTTPNWGGVGEASESVIEKNDYSGHTPEEIEESGELDQLREYLND